MSDGIEAQIMAKLDQGFTPKQLIKRGFKRSTIYKVAKLRRLEPTYELSAEGKIFAKALFAGIEAFADILREMPVRPRKLTAREKRKLR